MFDVGDRDLPVQTSGNWVIKGCITKWLRFFYVFNVFLKIQKNMTFYVFLRGCTRFLEHCRRWTMPAMQLLSFWLEGASTTSASAGAPMTYRLCEPWLIWCPMRDRHSGWVQPSVDTTQQRWSIGLSEQHRIQADWRLSSTWTTHSLRSNSFIWTAEEHPPTWNHPPRRHLPCYHQVGRDGTN